LDAFQQSSFLEEDMGFKRTITRDLVVSIIIVVVLISAVVVMLNYRIMSEKARTELETTADEYLAYLVSSLELPIWSIDHAAVLSIAESYGKNEQVAKLKINVTFNNATIFDLNKGATKDLVIRNGFIRHEGQIIGEVLLGLTPEFYRRTRQQLLVTSVMTTILISVALTGLTLLFFRLFLKRPFDNLIQGIEEISEGHYDYRFSQVRHGEIQSIIHKFVSMADRIKQREKSLQESESRFRSLVDQAADAFFLSTVDGRIIDVNRQACESLGYSRSELLNLRLTDIDATNDPGAYETIADRDGAAPGHLTMVSNHRRKDNSLFPVEIRAGFLELGHKQVILSLARDVTERKHAEDEMRRLRNLLGNIVNSMPSVLVGIDAAGNVTQWNQQAEEATGVAAAEALGRNLRDVFAILAGEMQNVKKAIAERRPQITEKVVMEINEKTRYADITVYPLVADGIEGAVIRMDDVSERVRIEEMIIQSEKMMSVGGLAAGMAHEINNPLGVILQSSQNIHRRLAPGLAANQLIAQQCGIELDAIIRYCEERNILKYIDGIHKAGARASKIVANMLNFSRRSESTLTYADPNRLIDATIDLASNDYDLKKKYDFRHITIDRDYAPNLPRIPVAITEIEQVVLNLLKNAAQAMAGKDVKAQRIAVKTRLDPGFVRIELSDNGGGMDEGTRKRAFEPFFTTKKLGEGTGLGLSVSYFIITNNHKGAMSVESSPGKGSHFVIRLPIEV